ncbi:MAG: hypothetical protein ACXW3O_12935, partial [Brevundimonas sp.]
MRRRALILSLILSATGLLAGCATTLPGPVELGLQPRCEVSADGDLTLRGPTNQAMLACVQKQTPLNARRVIVSSTGGDVASALSIAEMLAPLRAEIVVRGDCHSSCANYFLPVGRRITLEPNAWIILHGSIDGHVLAQQLALGGTRELYDRQMAFAERHDVPLGWLLFRTTEEFQAGAPGRHVTGSVQTWSPEGDANIAYTVVEEAFLRSCLPRVEVTPFAASRAQRLYADAPFRAR